MKMTLRRIGSGRSRVAARAGLVLGLLLPLAGAVAAAPLPARDARIVRVTVFPDRAEVVREATLQLPAGPSAVEFLALPLHVEPDSLRVSARGVPAVLGAVELRSEAREPEETPELVAAREEVRRLQRALAGLDAEQATARELRQFVEALKATTAARESQKLGEGRADPASIRAVYDLIKSSLAGLDAEALQREDRRTDLEKQLEVARARLAAARPRGPVSFRNARIEVEARQAGALTLRLEYLTRGATWRPAYRASLDAATEEIRLDSEAVVRQMTGEDWSGVALRLSTASPARGVQPPELSSWLLRPVEPAPRMAKSAPRSRAHAEADAVEGFGMADAEQRLLAAPAEVEAERVTAGIVTSGYNLAFEIPGRSDVAADGADHRVALRQDTLRSAVRYRAVPALNAAAFMVARTRAPAAYPLLAGPVRVFAAGAYLGAFALEETGAGAELTLPFGIDNRVAVDRVPLPEFRERSGVFGRDKRVSFAFRTTVENLRAEPVTVVLEDRVPVSQDERIKVELEGETTPGSQEVADRPGVREWTLEIAPRGKAQVTLAYTVRYPKDLLVPGVE